MKEVVENLVRQALAEDLGERGDVTTNALIPATHQSEAKIMARVDGILCGVQPALLAFQLVDKTLAVTFAKEDGAALKKGDMIASIRGATRSILTAERTALNFLTHLSGIATHTRRFVDAVAGTKAKILCTRKTIPGLRVLEKHAVRMGGAVNYRFGLYDAVLIKDNHLAMAGSLPEAVRLAKAAAPPGMKIEVEVDTIPQLQQALTTPADVVMLDNFSVADLNQAVVLTAGQVKLEASGGVTLATIRSIAETGVDYISVGAITHSAPALDIALDY